MALRAAARVGAPMSCCALARGANPGPEEPLPAGRCWVSRSPAPVGGSVHVCVATEVTAGLPPVCCWRGRAGEVVYGGWQCVEFECVGSRSVSSEARPVNVRAGTVDTAGCWLSDLVPAYVKC